MGGNGEKVVKLKVSKRLKKKCKMKKKMGDVSGKEKSEK